MLRWRWPARCAGPAGAPLTLLLFTILVFAAFRFSWRLVLVLAGYVLVCHAAADARVQGGTGLGLSLCKAAVEGCGGVIGYQNNPVKGATFWFELPRADL